MKSGSNLERVLSAEEFAVTAELAPPKNVDPEAVRNRARALKGYADAFNLTDCQRAVVRMSSIASACLALQEGVEPVIQMTCRDRNRIGLQADLLGAAALGIRNVVCMTGDHPSLGNHPYSKGVFDVDGVQLIKMVRTMRDEGRFQNGEKMDLEPRLFIGAVENPFAPPEQFRALRLAKKIAAGADFVQTQMVFDVKKFTRWMTIVRDMGLCEELYILAGVGPIKSAEAARYMKSKIPGMEIPDPLIDRLAALPREEARKEGVRICVDAIGEIREIPGVAGVHIMAIGWEEVILEITEAAGLLPRPDPKVLAKGKVSSGTSPKVARLKKID